jgi:hypothetical protein
VVVPEEGTTPNRNERRMNPRTTGLLALVAVILGGFIYFYEIGGESARQALRDDEKRIYPGLEADQIDAIELTTEEGIEARFERREGRWSVVSPISGRADGTALDAMSAALSGLSRKGGVASPDGLSQFGLGEEARTVYFEVAGESKGLRVGRSTPVGGHVYVTRLVEDSAGSRNVDDSSDENSDYKNDNNDVVAFVERYRINAFKRSLDDLRDRSIAGFDAGEVRTLRISWPGAGGEVEIAMARDESGDWQMGVPATGRADQQTVRELLSDLSFLNAKGFVDERTDATALALVDSAVTFHWTVAGDHLERRMRIAGEFEEGLLVEGPSGELYTIDALRLDDFKRGVSDYRFKLLSEFEVARARRLILEFVEEGEEPMRVEARLGEAGWAGTESRIDPNRASDLVRALASLRAVDIIADEMGPNELASLGLSPPRVRVRIEDRAEPDEETRVLADVAIGRLDEDRGLFGQRVGEGVVFVLPASTIDEIPHSRDAFMNDFEIRSGEAAEIGEELDPEILGADPLEGVEIP